MINLARNPFVNPFVNPFMAVPNFGGISPFASQIGGVNPLASQIGGVGANLPVGYGATGQFGTQFNPLLTGIQQSQFSPLAGGLGHSLAGINPNVVALALTNPAILNDPMVQALVTQQLPIRSLTGGMQAGAFQQQIPGLTPQITGQQWVDPYTAFVQAQLYSQLINNPLFQLSRGFGGMEAGGLGAQFAGQQFQTPLTNYPFGV